MPVVLHSDARHVCLFLFEPEPSVWLYLTEQHSAHHNAAQHSTTQNNRDQHGTAWRGTGQGNSAWHSTAWHNTARHSTAQHGTWTFSMYWQQGMSAPCKGFCPCLTCSRVMPIHTATPVGIMLTIAFQGWPPPSKHRNLPARKRDKYARPLVVQDV